MHLPAKTLTPMSSKTIAFFHNALGKTDGVSLEVDKWREVLQNLGHTVLYCAGNDDVPDIHCIPELDFLHPQTYQLIQNATVELKDFDEKTLEKKIHSQASIIKEKLLNFIQKNKVEILIPNNLLSVGYHVPALIALCQVIQETGLPTINHNHDFYFESSGEVHPTCQTVQKLLDTYSPPTEPNVQNLTINKIAKKALLHKKNIQATVVPNVFNFEQEAWPRDEYNQDFRKAIGIEPEDLLFQQATRVMDRKGIELAIDVIATLNQPQYRQILEVNQLYDGRQFTKKNKIILVCTGRIEKFGITHNYQQALQDKAQELNVDLRFVGDRVKHSRGTTSQGHKAYSIWDSYLYTDFVTYPSYWEGWGNQLIEATFVRLPILIFEYPVFLSDIKAANLDLVSLGDQLEPRDQHNLVTINQEKIHQAANHITQILTSPQKYKQMTQHNFKVCQKNFSYQTLTSIIQKLLKSIEN